MSRSNEKSERPLKTAVFHILLALSEGNRHGLGIADEVEHASSGAVRLGPGTLYRSLKEMNLEGLVEEVSALQADQDPRRKFYRITKTGREALKAEARRYAHVVELARQRRVLPEVR